MESGLTFIGFGEAGAALSRPGDRGWDRLLDDPAAAAAKRADLATVGVTACPDARAALSDARTVLSLVTADQAPAAARACAPLLAPGALWIDMNSVAPDTKRSAARAVEAAGGRYVDAAVMAPVLPKRRGVPVLLAGPHAGPALAVLAAAGFGAVSVQDGPVGAAAAVKMIRSVMVKGMEALSAERALAARRAGVLDAVAASLGDEWAGRFDYNLDRMMMHGTRRAAEMEEVVRTVEALGLDASLSRAAAAAQGRVGALALAAPDGLAAKLALLDPPAREEAA